MKTTSIVHAFFWAYIILVGASADEITGNIARHSDEGDGGGVTNKNRRVMNSCGENEVFVKCHSSSCFDKTCESLINARPCTRDCKRGCACIEGYVRELDGMCYPESICHQDEAS